ncbi:tRNA1(Val) (adenine(37)-N6)-methyltransferase [Alteromonas ponticola]|uniref:tRNA1(Val) (adenine(37)-N6)-methyltransferase n=1 Tax=Alteromonas ponticola TaxID=2720613 RepID=A0ABX1R4R2_9ALTE|nr:methyltransferase [Alteromonas ponticola]NMH61429.1 methyltransferase [Alteromonas ponticola]
MTIKRTVFQCKQFAVDQHQCAMKVNTDSLVLGSWANPALTEGPILDIGTGSGILALMMAQKSKVAQIDAIEIDELAAEQAKRNFDASPWARRLNAVHGDLMHFKPAYPYASIIANPPYFASPTLHTNAYTQLTPQRKLARIDGGLSISTVMGWVAQYLSQTGFFYCLYPAARRAEVVSLANAVNLICEAELAIQHNELKPAHVVAFKFRQSENRHKQYQIHRQTLIIRNQQAQYSQEFKTLCREFYLHF